MQDSGTLRDDTSTNEFNFNPLVEESLDVESE